MPLFVLIHLHVILNFPSGQYCMKTILLENFLVASSTKTFFSTFVIPLFFCLLKVVQESINYFIRPIPTSTDTSFL